MKRLLCLLLILCLPITALGETVAERIGAPDSWQGEFTTSTGKSPIRVNMTVEVPEVESIPIWQVAPHPFTVEEAAFAADHILGEGNWQQLVPAGNFTTASVEDGPRWITERPEGLPGWTMNKCHLYEMGNEQSEAVSVNVNFLDSMPGWYRSNSLHFWTAGEQRSIGSLEEAVAAANEMVSWAAPDMVYDEVMSFDELHVKSNPHYHLNYAREVGGVRITFTREGGARYAEEEFNPVLRQEELLLEVSEDGSMSLHWYDPLDVTGMIAEDCELLPFDQIMDIFGTVAPLTLLHLEGEGNVSLTIDRAVLGYMCLQERNNPRAYRLTPVWDFFGVRTLGRERQDFKYSWVTINAIDGTFIDRVYGY